MVIQKCQKKNGAKKVRFFLKEFYQIWHKTCNTHKTVAEENSKNKNKAHYSSFIVLQINQK